MSTKTIKSIIICLFAFFWTITRKITHFFVIEKLRINFLNNIFHFDYVVSIFLYLIL